MGELSVRASRGGAVDGQPSPALQSEQPCCGKSQGEEVLPGMPMGSRRLGDMSLLVVRTPANCSEAPEGVIDSYSALQIFDCDGLLCGRVCLVKELP